MTGDDPFERLGCPRRFRVADEEIRALQRSALARAHPDRAGDAMQRANDLRESALISAAARVLRNPIERAAILLRQAGIDPAPPAPPALLMQSLEWQEAIESARAEGEAPLAAARAPVEARRDEVLAELAEAIDGEFVAREGGAETGAEPPTRGEPSAGHAHAAREEPVRGGGLPARGESSAGHAHAARDSGKVPGHQGLGGAASVRRTAIADGPRAALLLTELRQLSRLLEAPRGGEFDR
ncbi:MAG: hypothetical protein KF724_13275 [Phycisphaeraceae bacterium]|nr:hypothetical protein [Phycisphaeraceae bacterium]